MADKLYIEEHFPIKSLEDLISCLFWNNHTDTRKSYTNPTYLDKELTRVECYASRRSFEDLLTLSRTYFPDTTEIDLMSVLKKLELNFYFCETIRKIVFHYRGYFSLNVNNFNQINSSYSYVENTYTADDLSKIYEQL